MKERIVHRAFQLIIRGILDILSGLIVVSHGLGFLITKLGSVARLGLRIAVPGVLFLYLRWMQLRRAIVQRFKFVKGHILYVLSHRYVAHGLVAFLVIFASVPMLSAADAPKGMFGRSMLLEEVVGTQELQGAEGGIVVDDLLPAEEFDSYLEARFQNQQPPQKEEEATMVLTLGGGALVKQELPGTTVPLTRTEVIDYVVQVGDNPWIIAEKFGLSVSTVLWENKLGLYSTIRPGQKLTILPVSGVSHTISKGDTLEKIAKKYKASADEIKQLNEIEDETELALGSKLVIPGGKKYVAPRPAVTQRREVVVPPSIAAKPGGKMLWPTNSQRITQYFKWRHAGLDIGNKMREPIYAAESGVVEIAGWKGGGWGRTVLINHGNGLKTRYAHATKVLVSPGEQVEKGKVIALVGSTGRSSGPHLHFGVYVNGRPVNPLKYLR